MLAKPVVAATFLAFLAAWANAVPAQDYPTKPVRILTAAAGGGSDLMSRQIAQGITGALGQPVIVENRVQLLAIEAASKSPPDGYTLLVVGSGVWIRPFLEKTTYNIADLTPVSLISRQVLILTVHPSLPVKSVKELIALAKARPGELNFAAAGLGGSPHLAGELFKAMAGINIVRVPYNGTPASITAQVSGEVQMNFLDIGLVVPLAKAGKLRALAVTSADASVLTPGLPTIAATLPGYEMVSLTTMFTPTKTPPAIINRLSQEIARFLSRPEIKEKLVSAGEEVVASTAEQSAAVIKAHSAMVSKLIKDAGISIEMPR